MDYRAALICTIIAEVNRDPKKRGRAFTPKDFMPKRKAEREITKELTGEQMLERAKIITSALGGEIK